MKEEGEDGSPKKTSTPIKVDNPNQFAPQGTDPREFKHKQKQVIFYLLVITLKKMALI